MRAGLGSTVMGALLLAGGCADPAAVGEAAAQNPERTTTTPPEPASHPDTRFLAERGGDLYRVNVRYVRILDESVIVVRQDGKEADESWPRIEVPAGREAPSALPFGADPWREVAVEIAETVRRRPEICPDGAPMQLLPGDDGAPRTLYRQNRRAWVVFGACPQPSAG